MSSVIEIIEYIPTPEAYQWGVLKCSYKGMIICFQVKGKKEDQGYFIISPSINCGSKENPNFVETFEIDSRSEYARIMVELKAFVDQYYGFAPSVTRAQPSTQPAGFASGSVHHPNTQPRQAMPAAQGGWQQGQGQGYSESNLPF